ncbi:HtaA domain-containing protein [Streptomyces sp. NPDC001262]|uniref:HtaA domain-containing protein n=1 Tax=Streptomyces sp. NPDC001262 TaxID=3364552 RepID=UPI0036AFC66F
MTVTALRRLAYAAVVSLGAMTLTVPAAHAGEGAAPKGMPLKDGTLEWGVKESFRQYVTGPIGGGRIEAADGARQADGGGPFTFTGGTGSYDMATHAVATTFKGSVRFLGHQKEDKSWELDIKLADVKVKTQGASGSITADVTTAGGATQDDVTIASLDLSAVRPGGGAGGAMTFAKIPAKLTGDGAKAFKGFYKEGQELDAATLSVKAGGGDGGGQREKPQPQQKPESPAPKSPAPAPGVEKPKASAEPAKERKEPAAPALGTIADGNLDWGVKKSFRDYVTGPVAGGKAEVSGGAGQSGDGYRFPKGHGSYDAGTAALDAAFDGAVRFTGHEGQLDLKLSDLKVKANGTSGTLYADVSAKERSSGKVVDTDDMPLAKLKLPADALKAKDGVVSVPAAPATLTAQGAKAFGGMYKEGQDLDPVNVTVSVDKNATLPAATSAAASGTAELAQTGASTGPLLAAAGALALAGGAAVYATRRRGGVRG